MSSKKLNIFLIAIIVTGVGLFIGKRIYFSSAQEARIPQKDYGEEYIASRRRILEDLPIDTNDVVFVGNSLTEGFPLNEMFHTLAIKNRGIAGSKSSQVLHRISSIANNRPRKIFIEVGINDLTGPVSMDSLLRNYKAIVDLIRSKSPKTKIYIQSLLPLGRSRKEHERRVDSFNNILEAYSREKSIQFINLFPFFLKDSFLNSTLTYDDLHLNGPGYKLWKALILPYVL